MKTNILQTPSCSLKNNSVQHLVFFSSNIKLKPPYDVVEDKQELHYTYLDTIGRPVIVAHKTNIVEQHIQDFEVPGGEQ